MANGAPEDLEQSLKRLQAMRTNFHRPRASEADDLRERVHETRNWCRRNVRMARVKDCLRPQSIAPPALSETRWHAVHEVRRARRRELAEAEGLFHIPAVGRFLVYFPDADLFDGAAEASSDGFFDVHNAPPWGSWVGYFKESIADRDYASYLLAWVPMELVPLASEGIHVNPEQCIAWLEDTNTEIKDILESLAIRP